LPVFFRRTYRSFWWESAVTLGGTRHHATFAKGKTLA
jgi:hypothetical protein